ncbi:uncharacterized protein LOC128547554 [Mercenaria mercenaria]|uniref:uncharacterized protein LOC128547554 n=1 Tax=Mercenaria mercenaria TaxID=6596 RepID=UPI00234F6AE7|nr:uncharacterized protein LOC128547554 [Mercenaria mercenaria]
MVRRKKTDPSKQGKWSADAMIRAIAAIKSRRMSIRKAAKSHGIPKSTLERRVNGKVQIDAPPTRPPVFTEEQESQLVEYILEMENCGFGLTIRDICKLAFEFAIKLDVKHRFSVDKQKAGYDWYEGFMRRHKQLAIRKPEGLSAARAKMLNQNVVTAYFKLLSGTIEKCNLHTKGAQIYNVDETGMNTVHQPAKVIGQKGKKNIHSKTSGDRGENVTAVVCASASGHFIPPMIIFKGQRLNKGIVSNAPTNTLFATSKSSFIDRELFQDWFENHFLKYLPSTRPVLLILDGHTSHIGLRTLTLAKENKIEILCLPPHTTSELQPLDKCIFKPLKVEYNKACMQFLKENPGKIVTRYDFCGLFKKAYYKVCTMNNAASAFRATGIHPLNPSVIHPDVYGPSTTSQLLTEQNEASGQGLDTVSNMNQSTTEMHGNGNTNSNATPENANVPSTSNSTVDRSPRKGPLQDLFKVPKVYKRVSNGTIKKSKRITSARCLTATEVIEELEAKEREKEQKQIDKENRLKQRELKKQNKSNTKGKSKAEKCSTNTLNKETKADQTDSSENYCTYCAGYYFDDDFDDEDWIKCQQKGCNSWYHESCTGMFGKFLSEFFCEKHI